MYILTFLGQLFSLIGKALTWTRHVIANTIFVLVLVVVIAAVLSSGKSTIEPNTVFVLNPSGVLVEETFGDNPATALFHHLGSAASPTGETKVQDVIDAIGAAADNPNILAMVIEPSWLQGCDTSKLLEIGAAIRAFKDSGKPVWSYGTAFTQGQYLLASYADKICVSPLGGVAITGFGLYPNFYKGLLDKAHVNFHIFRVGEYKSAVEPFQRASMSDEARYVNKKWLGSLWQTYQDTVAANRKISPRDIAGYVDQIDTRLDVLDGDAAHLALEIKLVDEVQSKDHFDLALATRLGKPLASLRWLELIDYTDKPEPSPEEPKEKIAIIRARGAILPGRQPENLVGSESIRELFERARADANTVAVVLRLDSPGGSATASEEIHREIIRTQDAGKPVVVSMGSVAASGAYWIATAANRIVAAPTTLTGSIGIFAAIPTFEDTAREWGVTSDGVGTTSISDFGNPLRPLPAKAANAIPHLLKFGYSTFLDRVATGRRMPREKVEESAGGRVFIGQEAYELQLVDQLGGIQEAVQIAGDLAGSAKISSYELRRELSPQEALLRQFFSSKENLPAASSGPLQQLLAPLEEQARMLSTYADPRHLYARSLECEAMQP